MKIRHLRVNLKQKRRNSHNFSNFKDVRDLRMEK